VGWRTNLLAGTVALSLATVLSACSSGVIDSIPNSLGGLPENAPERQAVPAPFPSVHEMPPARGDVRLSEAERQRLKQELIEQRARNEKAAAETTGTVAPAGTAPKP
jgi:hypothetical protein